MAGDFNCDKYGSPLSVMGQHLKDQSMTIEVGCPTDAAKVVSDWMREPDYVERFTSVDCADWLNRRPVPELAILVAAISAPVKHEETKPIGWFIGDDKSGYHQVVRENEGYPCTVPLYARASDPYPSTEAMKAAVELEIEAALGNVQTVIVGRLIQKAVDTAIEECAKIVENEASFADLTIGRDSAAKRAAALIRALAKAKP